MRDWTEDQPSLERPHSGPWIGRFPGLGTVTVAEDGAVSVEVDPATGPDEGEDPALRADALRHGWGEALSFARRGYTLAHGAAICPPSTPVPVALPTGAESAAPAVPCLILNGDPHDAAIVMLHLTGLGWRVMGDKFTPTRWEDGVLVAYPREAPVIASARRLRRNDIEGVKPRAHTDSRVADLPRVRDPRPIAGIVSLQMRKPDEVAFEVLTGHDRFQAAANLMSGGATYPWRAEDAPDDADGAGLDASPAGSAALADANSNSGAADVPASIPADDEAARKEREARVQALAARALAEHMRLARLPFAQLRLDSDTLTEDCDALLAWWDDVTGGTPA